jgi:O-antigen biosynthesis protein WbqP
MLYNAIKRCFDILLSGMALLFLGAVLLATALIIKINSPGSIIFAQRRVGCNDKEFVMYKFRTMHVGTPEVATDKLKDSKSYITSVGYYLRKYSIDELPQLVNILIGDMSIVGPRPALYNQYDLRELRNAAGVSKIRPGLTGWAQVNGRDEIPLEQKVALDSQYLRQRSFTFDLQIIYRTIFSVYSGDGIQAGANQKKQA